MIRRIKEDPDQRRNNLLRWMQLYKIHASTTYIKNNAEIYPLYGQKIYNNSHTLSVCRNDLIQLEWQGYINRSQYLNGPIRWNTL